MKLPPLAAAPMEQPPIHRLDDETARSVLRLSALLGLLGKWSGPTFHAVLGQWLAAAGTRWEGGLATWCQEHWARWVAFDGFQGTALGQWRAERFERAGAKANDWWRQGVRVWIWRDDGLPALAGWDGRCPRVLFGRGDLTERRPWLAVFNSRKARNIGPTDRWLVALHALLPELARLHVTLAGSGGTLSYDLVSYFAQRQGIPQVMIKAGGLLETVEAAVPAPGDAPGEAADAGGQAAGSDYPGVLSCGIEPLACARATTMTCRDRLLAHLADLHVLLEIRDRGNLLEILQHQQRHRPKTQWILEAAGSSAGCRGNVLLLDEFPQSADLIATVASAEEATAASRGNAEGGSDGGTDPALSKRGSVKIAWGPEDLPREGKTIVWDRYLFHYTRSCPGPWPGQSYQQYLADLLDGKPECGHSALDTLRRILGEGRVRGSHRLVRGLRAVVSWTSRPPWDLAGIRRWNRALIRWTFEPYGIAVSRRELRKLGVKPVIYGAAGCFERLPPDERFRFQLWGSGTMTWKSEHEWRLPGDLMLLSDMDAFVFVPDVTSAERLKSQGQASFPMVVLGGQNQVN